eukprot:4626602-Prymnesium_polylepis.1
MSNEGFGAMVYHDIGERRVAAGLRDRRAVGLMHYHRLSMSPSILRFTNVISLFVDGTNGCRAGGRRQAGEDRAEHLWQPPRRLSRAARPYW